MHLSGFNKIQRTRILALSALGLLFFAATSAVVLAFPGKKAMVEEIEKVLKTQVAAWNDGDLDRFMGFFLNSPNTSYVSGGHSIRGYENIRAHYESKYGKALSKEGQAGSDSAAAAQTGKNMGRLSTSGLDIRILNKDHALASGRWNLVVTSDGEAKTYGGRFSLVLILKGGGWKIVHDHTSNEEKVEGVEQVNSVVQSADSLNETESKSGTGAK